MNILKICELRYYQNLAVAKIATEIGVSEEEVIAVLDLITDSLRD